MTHEARSNLFHEPKPGGMYLDKQKQCTGCGTRHASLNVEFQQRMALRMQLENSDMLEGAREEAEARRVFLTSRVNSLRGQ